MLPRALGRKLPVLVLAFILAGCGGNSEPKTAFHEIRGPGFRFDAPVGWKATTAGRTTTAASGSELVQVAGFPLAHPYTPALFDKVESELAIRMAQVAKGGKLTGPTTVTAGGIRSHAYTVEIGDHVDAYVFVLRDKREYQLLCRRKSSSSTAFCDRLVSSFTLG